MTAPKTSAPAPASAACGLPGPGRSDPDPGHGPGPATALSQARRMSPTGPRATNRTPIQLATEDNAAGDRAPDRKPTDDNLNAQVCGRRLDQDDRTAERPQMAMRGPDPATGAGSKTPLSTGVALHPTCRTVQQPDRRTSPPGCRRTPSGVPDHPRQPTRPDTQPRRARKLSHRSPRNDQARQAQQAPAPGAHKPVHPVGPT